MKFKVPTAYFSKLNIISFLCTFLLSSLIYVFIPLNDAVLSTVYVTKSSRYFGYATLYGLQLPTAIYVITVTALVHRKSNNKTPTVHPSSGVQNIHVSIAGSSTSSPGHLYGGQVIEVHQTAQPPPQKARCTKLAKRSVIHIFWFAVTRVVLITITTIFYIHSNSIDTHVIHFSYISLYLCTSSYPMMYLIVNKQFTKAVYKTLVQLMSNCIQWYY